MPQQPGDDLTAFVRVVKTKSFSFVPSPVRLEIAPSKG